MRRLIYIVLAVAVLGIGAAVAVFLIRGSDEPPPPELSTGDAQPQEATPAPSQGADTWEVAGGGETFVGYRVRERFATVGVVDAVGRTGEVTGTFTIRGDQVRRARMEADLASLRSDEGRRDNALRSRGIETDAFPRAEFRLTEPFEISRKPTRARGELTLHGETNPITATVRGQRLGDDAIELVGSAPIEFARFGIEPPSVAGFVTVRDEGELEFKLRLRPT